MVQQGQQPVYEGLEVSIVRLDEDHILLGVPTPTGVRRHISHTVDEVVELFKSYVIQLMSQRPVASSEAGHPQTAADWQKEMDKNKKPKGDN